MLENYCNELWKKIVERKNLSSDFRKVFVSHHSQLPILEPEILGNRNINFN